MPISPPVSVNDTFKKDLLAGLAATPKTTGLPLHLYDDRGSDLFRQITDLSTYYQTGAEAGILRQHASQIAAQLCRDVSSVCLLELGTGDGHKTRPLIEACGSARSDCQYVANDICPSVIGRALAQYNECPVQTYSSPGCYEEALAWLATEDVDGRKVVLFLGSTIGNMTPSEQVAFLQLVRQSLRAGDALVLGIDTKHGERKSALVIEDAYRNEVTELFIKNILVRANSELGADFDCGNFTYHASYNPGTACVEMWLMSDLQQAVVVAGKSFLFEPGESLLVEQSHKFNRFDIERLAHDTGFQVQEPYWAATDDYFLNVVLQAI